MIAKANPRGRPPKPPPPAANVCDVSLEGLQAGAAAIQRLFDVAAFRALSETQKMELADRLAYEVTVYPALDGLIKQTKGERRGPKRQGAHIAFVATVRDILKSYGVCLPQWENAYRRRDDLLTFCHAVASYGGLKLHVSARTAKNLTAKGFTQN